MNIKYGMLLFFVLWVPSLIAGSLPKDFDVDSRLGFVAGEYILIGIKPDSQETFSGRVTLERKKDKLSVTRVVDGRVIHGVAFFDTEPPTSIVYLVMRFFGKDNKGMEAWYMMQSDANNYPIMTGKLYHDVISTKKEGLEAMFPVGSLRNPECWTESAKQGATPNP